MPPALKSSKRKAADDTAESEIVDPPQQDTAAQAAKRMMLAKAAIPSVEAKHSSGNAGSVNVKGIVVAKKRIMVDGKKGKVPKEQVTILATSFAVSGSNTVVTSNIDGVAFGLPTKQMEASPDEIAKNADAKGPLVIEVGDANSRVNYLGFFTAGFYVDSAKPGQSAKPEAAAAEMCTVGMTVLVSGVSCSFSRSGDVLYTNAKKIAPLSAPIAPHKSASRLIAELADAPAQAVSAFLLSSTCHGLFNFSDDDTALQAQASASQDMWNKFTATLASRCDNIAAGLTGDVERAATAAAMSEMGTRVRGLTGEEAAQGTMPFNVNLPRDCTTGYVAPIVQQGVTPGLPVPAKVIDIFDPSVASKMPKSWCAAKVTKVNFRGNLIQADCRLWFVADLPAAQASIAERKNPTIDTMNPTVSFKMSKKTFGPEVLGTVINAKIEIGGEELLPYMNLGTTVSVFPRAIDDITLDGHFASTSGFDMPDGISKVGPQVSREWLDKHMLGSRGVYIYTAPEDMDMVERATGAGPDPTLVKSGYQALSESAFELESLKAPTGMGIKYHVVFKGCADHVAFDDSLATSVDAGEAHVSSIVSTMREDGDLKAFLRTDCLVYAVACDD